MQNIQIFNNIKTLKFKYVSSNHKLIHNIILIKLSQHNYLKNYHIVFFDIINNRNTGKFPFPVLLVEL